MLGLDYHGHPFPAAAKRRAGYSVTPLHYAFEMGGGGAKRCPDSEKKQQSLGSKFSQSTKKSVLGFFFQQRKESGLPVSDTGRICWV